MSRGGSSNVLWIAEYTKTVLPPAHLHMQRRAVLWRQSAVFLLPAVVGADESGMELIFRLQPGRNSFFKGGIGAQVVPFALETDAGSPCSPVVQADPAKAAGVVAAVFAFFQPFHTGAVHHVQPGGHASLDLPFQAAAAAVVPVNESVFADFDLLAAVAPAVPVDRPLLPPSVRGKKGGQPPKPSTGQVKIYPPLVVPLTSYL